MARLDHAADRAVRERAAPPHHHHWHAAQWRHNLLESVVFTSGDDAPLADALNAGVTTGQPVRVALVGRGRRAAYPRLLEDALAGHGRLARALARPHAVRPRQLPVGVASLRGAACPRASRSCVTELGSWPARARAFASAWTRSSS